MIILGRGDASNITANFHLCRKHGTNFSHCLLHAWQKRNLYQRSVEICFYDLTIDLKISDSHWVFLCHWYFGMFANHTFHAVRLLGEVTFEKRLFSIFLAIASLSESGIFLCTIALCCQKNISVTHIETCTNMCVCMFVCFFGLCVCVRYKCTYKSSFNKNIFGTVHHYEHQLPFVPKHMNYFHEFCIF